MTHLSDLTFKSTFIEELNEVSNRFVTHIWDKALDLTIYPIHVQDQTFALLASEQTMNLNKMDMWTKYSKDHGYGVFHKMLWNPDTLKYTMQVSMIIFMMN